MEKSLDLLPRAFYQRDTVTVAKDLLGTLIVREWNNILLVGMIAETEAYLSNDDPASHAYKKKTPRNAAMFDEVGHTYLYFIYGNHYCLNFVARSSEQLAGAVLIRTVVPLQGIEHMRYLRKKNSDKELTNGPGKLCQAFALTTQHNRYDITTNNFLYVTKGIAFKNNDIIHTPRIGITKAQDKLWRFVLRFVHYS